MPAGEPVPCRVTVCRGCCCGTSKVPGLDHDQQVADLARRVPTRVSECLDVCAQANVVVVQPSAAGRRAGGRPVWLGLVNDDAVLDDLTAWIDAGGPGIAVPPAVLDLYAIPRPPAGT
ncbi:hypothetical protein [Actinomadura flavalba]|uniref:hypothetical protein n=1 Tax=Actinomadura flavalba TaxID=1120938 RepID=UPI00039F2CEE